MTAFDPNAVKTALYGALTADSTLTGLLASSTAVYDARPPQGAALPCVIFQQVTGLPSYTFTGRAWDDCLFLIKAVTKGDSAVKAGAIAKRVEEVLNDTDLGGTAIYLRRENTIDYPEVSEGVTYRHLGGQYRVWTS